MSGANRATLAVKSKPNLKPIHDMNTPSHPPTQGNPRIYLLHPFPPVALALTDPDPMSAAKTPLTATVPSLPPRQPLPTAVIDPAKPMLKLGLDVHLESIMVVAQKDHANPQAPRKFTNDQLVEQVKRWTTEGLQVFCVQESCGFGFVLHRRLVEAGAQSFLITPIALNGQRKTDKLDARALCLRLSRWLDGNRDELAPIRIPSEAEQRRREVTRRRQFLAREIRCLANRGHGQVAEYCHENLPHHWWGPRNWQKLAKLDPWVLGLLSDLRTIILALEEQVRALEAEIKARIHEQPRPKGLGELTLVTLEGEVCDWHRFSNRKQIGSYTGCCPGEHSSGDHRRVGSIDRMGNGRVRALLVEAVWRFLKWQPQWKAAQRMKVKLADGTSMRKKTVIALARQLAIDLWRWRTGRCTMADLGWVAA
ncbi:MAG: IS110 family transposase [Myxococcaceae bacterium]